MSKFSDVQRAEELLEEIDTWIARATESGGFRIDSTAITAQNRDLGWGASAFRTRMNARLLEMAPALVAEVREEFAADLVAKAKAAREEIDMIAKGGVAPRVRPKPEPE